MWCRHKLLWFLRSRYLLCGKLSYFIYTKIYTVKLHHSCLWLDQQCIFMGSSLFPIFELKCEKICQYVWNKNIIPWKVLEWFLFTSCDTAKNSLICHARFFFFFLCFPTRELKLFRAHFLWNNLSLSASEINKKPCHLQLFSFNICICCNKGLMVDRSALKICWLKKFVYSQLMTKYCPGLFYIAPCSLIKFVIMVQFFSYPGTCFSNVPVT